MWDYNQISIIPFTSLDQIHGRFFLMASNYLEVIPWKILVGWKRDSQWTGIMIIPNIVNRRIPLVIIENSGALFQTQTIGDFINRIPYNLILWVWYCYIQQLLNVQSTPKSIHTTNYVYIYRWKWISTNPLLHGSLNVPIEHHPTIRSMVYNSL